MARLVYNTNGWIMPSGKFGKSNHKHTHEFKYGYGHEEWIFDLGKQINGYKYAFLEPIRKSQESYTSGIYDVWLYTINNITKKRYWIGEIKNVEVLNLEESKRIYKLYKEKGWIKEMKEQISMCNSDSKSFSNSKDIDLFNIKYNINNLILNDTLIEIDENNPIYKLSRYSFAKYKSEYCINNSINEDFSFILNDDANENKEVQKKTYFRDSRPIEISYIHEHLSKKVTQKLKSLYGAENALRELRSGVGGTKIDIVVKSKMEGIIFYEIKTYNSLKLSIREAIGQLLEYSMWSNKKRADKLIVLTPKHPEIQINKAKVYFKHLRKQTGLNIFYQYFDLETNYLSDSF